MNVTSLSLMGGSWLVVAEPFDQFSDRLDVLRQAAGTVSAEQAMALPLLKVRMVCLREGDRSPVVRDALLHPGMVVLAHAHEMDDPDA